jgi:C1A family cysteine protease
MAAKKKVRKVLKPTLKQIRAGIKTKKHDWKVGESKIWKLSTKEQDLRLGLNRGIVKKEKKRIKFALTKEKKTFSFTPVRDWRNKDGKNWVTPVKDQGGCGSCVAFGSVATIESQARIQYNKPSWEIELSEADLFFCGAGRRCSQGWWPSYALDYAKNKGISDEGCFPYEDHDMDCNVCDNKADRYIKIGNWHEIINIDQRKEWLDKKGPMVACMAVYRDFFGYKDGVYHHEEGGLAGYHAIACIGYSEEESCWICKNSWGDDWGNNGFFKIGYGECEIDTSFAMYAVENISGPLKPNGEDGEEGCARAQYLVVDHLFELNRRVLWAYVKGKWRYKLLSDTQTLGIGTTIVPADPVEVCFKNNEITRILGWKILS